MEIYLVGGAVRDELLGLVPRDHDYVVINSSPEEMKRLGFLQVGSNYEVFLHPKTKDEYVLAENLEQDLKRRDLTINAMAKDEKENLIDLFHGQEDLKKKILRHTSQHFADDPLRVYRLARFKVRYSAFSIAEETMVLAKDLVTTVAFKELNGERILQEFKEALGSGNAEAFFNTLLDLNAMDVHLGIITDWSGLDAKNFEGPMYSLAWLLRKSDPMSIRDFAKTLFMSNDWLEAALVSNRVYKILPELQARSAEELVELFYEIDSFRKPYLISFIKKLYPGQGEKLAEYFHLIKDISVKDISSAKAGKEIGEEIRNERMKRLAEKSGVKDPS